MAVSTLTQNKKFVKSELQLNMEKAATLAATIHDLESQLAEHRSWLKDYMIENNETSLRVGNFEVILKSRHNWTYSVETTEAMNNVKQMQKYEQINEIAQDAIKQFVAFTFKPVT